MLEIKINIHADKALLQVLDNLADCWCMHTIVQAGGDADKLPIRQKEPIDYDEGDETQNLGAIPVSANKEQEINEFNAIATAQQTESVSTKDDKLTESELVDIRAKAQAFMKGDAANKDKVKAWLNENGLARVTEMPRSAVTSFLALIEGGNS